MSLNLKGRLLALLQILDKAEKAHETNNRLWDALPAYYDI
jgi:hypothetical protein